MVGPSVISRISIRRYGGYAIIALGMALWIGSLLLLTKTTQNSEQFGRLHPWILLINAIAVVLLLVLLAFKLAELIGDYRRHVIGSRLKARTVSIFGALVVAPLIIVYSFSLAFLDRGIDSWFDIELKQDVNDAVRLSRSVFDLKRRDYLQRVVTLAQELTRSSDSELLDELAQERRHGGASEITIFGRHGRIVSTSSDRPLLATPQPLSEEILLQVRQGQTFTSLEPAANGMPETRGGNGSYVIRAAAPFKSPSPNSEPRVVLAQYPVALPLSELVDTVQRAHARYSQLAYLRGPLKNGFRLTLTLVLLLSLLAAVYGAFFSAQRLVKPIQDLAAGTRAVGKGDFDTRLPLTSRDEMGFLVHSFNDMTKRLARAREEAQRSQQALLQAQRESAWGEVARRLAHEIKNPLTPIQLAAERLRRRFLDSMNPEDAQILERSTRTIVQQVEAMKQMVNAFSEYARAPELQLAPFDLNTLIVEVAELYRTHDSKVQWKFELDPAVGTVTADQGRLRQILNNLFKNSTEALEGRPEARIEITTRREIRNDHAFAGLIVSDNGPGFDPASLERIFEPYVSSKPKGTGLGLAIVKKIVEEHGGSIEADNRRSGGARLKLLLPLEPKIESKKTELNKERA